MPQKNKILKRSLTCSMRPMPDEVWAWIDAQPRAFNMSALVRELVVKYVEKQQKKAAKQLTPPTESESFAEAKRNARLAAQMPLEGQEGK